MRPIKFRAWDKDTNTWLEGVTYTLHTSGHLLTKPREVELMQYTGLKDCKGKEIYEGDICTVNDGMVYSSVAHKMVEGHYQVYWNNDRWGLRHGEHEDYNNGDYYRGDEITWSECEVIGNIYENPELLETTT